MGLLGDVKKEVRQRCLLLDRDQAKDIAAILRRTPGPVFDAATDARRRDVSETVKKFQRRVGEMN